MKVLFVGEGPHDIGASSFAARPRIASGVVATLSRKIKPAIANDSVALAWREITLLNRSKRGHEHKLLAAKELAARQGCQGMIAVVDRDGDEARVDALKRGRARIESDGSNLYPVAIGVAVESIEAWSLGDPRALAAVIGVSVEEIQNHYNPARAETYYERSGKEENQPKAILRGIAALGHLQDSEAFRREVAERADINVLQRNCPHGFALFAEDIRSNFPEVLDS